MCAMLYECMCAMLYECMCAMLYECMCAMLYECKYNIVQCKVAHLPLIPFG